MASKGLIIGIVVLAVIVVGVVAIMQFGSQDTQDTDIVNADGIVVGTVYPDGTIVCTEEGKICPDGTVVGRVAPDCEFARCPNQTSQETPQEPQPFVKEFVIEADDGGFYLNGADIGSISASAREALKITFNVRTTNVYYGGLQFKGCDLDTGKVSSGGSTTVEFSATNTCTITSYWPSSSRVKDNLQVIVG